MSALADALLAAQRRSIAALEKAYTAGAIQTDQMTQMLNGIGCTETVEQTHLLAALEVIRIYGAEAPNATNAGAEWKADPATDAQKRRITRDCDAASVPYPDWEYLSKGQA